MIVMNEYKEHDPTTSVAPTLSVTLYLSQRMIGVKAQLQTRMHVQKTRECVVVCDE